MHWGHLNAETESAVLNSVYSCTHYGSISLSFRDITMQGTDWTNGQPTDGRRQASHVSPLRRVSNNNNIMLLTSEYRLRLSVLKLWQSQFDRLDILVAMTTHVSRNTWVGASNNDIFILKYLTLICRKKTTIVGLRQCRINPSGALCQHEMGGLLTPLPFPFPSPPSYLPLLFPSPFLPLEVGPLAPLAGWAEPHRKSILVHFSLEIWHLVAPILLIFLRINWPQCMHLF